MPLESYTLDTLRALVRALEKENRNLKALLDKAERRDLIRSSQNGSALRMLMRLLLRQVSLKLCRSFWEKIPEYRRMKRHYIRWQDMWYAVIAVRIWCARPYQGVERNTSIMSALPIRLRRAVAVILYQRIN